MTDSLMKCLKERLDLLPTCKHYRELLDTAHAKTGIFYSTLRSAMGLYTYAQWATFLGI